MNLFCRLFGHTFVYHTTEPKIRWTTSKQMNELEQTVTGEPEAYLECARCGERKHELSPDELRRVS